MNETERFAKSPLMQIQRTPNNINVKHDKKYFPPTDKLIYINVFY